LIMCGVNPKKTKPRASLLEVFARIIMRAKFRRYLVKQLSRVMTRVVNFASCIPNPERPQFRPATRSG
jgi:hypothetical protein